MRNLTILLLLLLLSTGWGQEMEWIESFGGSNDDYTWHSGSVQQTSDGGYIIVGSTESFSETSCFLYNYRYLDGGTWDSDYISWDIIDETDNIVFTGDGYGWSSQNPNGGEFCLPAGTYTIHLHDNGASCNGWGGILMIYIGGSIEIVWDTGCNCYVIEGMGVAAFTLSDGCFGIEEKTFDDYCWEDGVGSPHTCKMHSDIWLIKTDSNGQEEWSKSFGDQGVAGLNVQYGAEQGHSVLQTQDDGYMILGTSATKSEGPYSWDTDIWLIKTHSNGSVQWQKNFEEISVHDMGMTIRETSDGGYIIADGFSNSYLGSSASTIFWLLKVDINGQEEWYQYFSTDTYDGSNFIQQTSDEGYIIIGSTNYPNYDVMLLKMNSVGQQEWLQTYGGIENDLGMYVEELVGGDYNDQTIEGYIIAGYTYSYGLGSSDAWLIKTDSNGQEEWSKTFGGSYKDKAYVVQQTDDLGYIITGYSFIDNYNADVFLIKTDSEGFEEWSQTYGAINPDEFGYSSQLTVDGGLIVAGQWNQTNDKNILLMKIANIHCPGDIYDCLGECNGLAEVDECGICNGDGIAEGFCDCEENINTCYLCPSIDPNDYGLCDVELGYAFTGQDCGMIYGCGTGNDNDYFTELYTECTGNCPWMDESFSNCIFDCQNCKVLNPSAYGACELELGWGWSGEDCEMIYGCGWGSDEPWFYESYEICITRCEYDEYECFEILGDINNDTSVNILDIVILANCILEDNCVECYDLNEDSILNILDIVILANIILESS